jgi:phage tail-like protein
VTIPALGNPLTAFKFIVTLDPADAYLPPAQAALLVVAALGGFQEVRGLGGELEVTPYPEGGVNDHVHQLPVRHTWSRLSLRRGVAAGPGLWLWYLAGLTNSLGARRDGAILLLTPGGIPAVAWEFRAGLAAKWTGPDLSAMENTVALESLEIAHEGITQVPSVVPPVMPPIIPSIGLPSGLPGVPGLG